MIYSQPDREASLVDAAKARNLHAFEQLVSEHRHRILRLAYRMTKNEADAEDVVQNAFMKAFVHLPDFNGRSKFSTWLTRIAINESLLNIRRRQHRSSEIPVDGLPDADNTKALKEIPAPDPSPEQTCSYHEQQELMGKMIHHIKPIDRGLLHLYLNEDLSYRQIARRLGMSATAVRSRMHRTRMDIRKSLDAQLTTGTESKKRQIGRRDAS